MRRSTGTTVYGHSFWFFRCDLHHHADLLGFMGLSSVLSCVRQSTGTTLYRHSFWFFRCDLHHHADLLGFMGLSSVLFGRVESPSGHQRLWSEPDGDAQG